MGVAVMWTAAFWRDTAERVATTAAAAALAALGANRLGLGAIDWPGFGSTVAGAALVALLTALVGGRRGDPDTASLLAAPRGRHARD